MAISNWTNYAAIAPQKSGLDELFANALKGYQIQREPQKMRDEEETRQRDNALKAIQQKFEPQLYGAQINHLNAQSEGAMNPMEKMFAQEQFKEKLQQNKEDIKEQKALESSARDQSEILRLLAQAEGALSKHPIIGSGKLASIAEGVASIPGMKNVLGEEYINPFETLKAVAPILQGKLARYISPGRGNVYSTQLAKTAKIGPELSPAQNRALIKILRQMANEDIQAQNKRYGELTQGKKLPYAASGGGDSATVKIRNKKTGVSEEVTVDEARRRGIKNV